MRGLNIIQYNNFCITNCYTMLFCLRLDHMSHDQPDAAGFAAIEGRNDRWLAWRWLLLGRPQAAVRRHVRKRASAWRTLSSGLDNQRDLRPLLCLLHLLQQPLALSRSSGELRWFLEVLLHDDRARDFLRDVKTIRRLSRHAPSW